MKCLCVSLLTCLHFPSAMYVHKPEKHWTTSVYCHGDEYPPPPPVYIVRRLQLLKICAGKRTSNIIMK